MRHKVLFGPLSVNLKPHYFGWMAPKTPNSLTSLQCRMARAGLEWTIQDLMHRTNLGRTTIIRFEGGQSSTTASTRTSLRRAFEEAGVEFVEDYGVNIRGGSE